ncbi:phosphoribosyl-aminoimidazole carboxylase [Eremomyces bilateralis CBS 781.70]|uniref:Phosphoribosylaminoimidazole carboxylase n=1 Tax=Eremomyces bilateralis CBS 781.70 TaxID=1392243 RepID=A0A6G1GCQ1_9PEZI|nr:phosphoribosyl-aminoimidazole carboxylase [Eremomyces bilateralis CBS 781.70]KAF1815680.1 phosphoribosyl-aminoimidazole carboxylase [Eremomyces bilateralis CBS 781.70]
MDNLPRVGLLGGGQLGRMLIEESNRLNIPISVLDADQAPAKQIHAHPKALHVNGSFAESEAVRKLASNCDILTVEIEHVDTTILEEAANAGVRVEPSWKTIRTIQDKYVQKQYLESHFIKTAAASQVDFIADLEAAGVELGYPMMLKARKQAYDGKGNYVVESRDDVHNAFEALGKVKGGMYAEKWADFKTELAVMVLKTKDGVFAYPTVELISQDSVCKLVYAPVRGVSTKVKEAAQKLAKEAVAPFEGKGVFGVELFLLQDDSLLVNEIAPRPHNTGHYTIEACPNSQFAGHLRAILDLPIPPDSLKQTRPAIMLNILGGKHPDSHQPLLLKALAIPNATIHMYGKGASKPGRKIGHVTVTASTMREAESAMAPLLAEFDTLRAERFNLPPPTTAPPAPSRHPVVSVTAGSISDQTVLANVYTVLEKLGIAYEKKITSAHRTPEYMATYAKEASARGVRVIIAAAGGAAHLPGMVAAFNKSIPVIGLPVKPSKSDGMDSLVSMTNMPRGVPVLTVGIDNGVNAALGAGRIVGCWDEGVRERVERYAEEAAEESLENDRRMEGENEKRNAL